MIFFILFSIKKLLKLQKNKHAYLVPYSFDFSDKKIKNLPFFYKKAQPIMIFNNLGTAKNVIL